MEIRIVLPGTNAASGGGVRAAILTLLTTILHFFALTFHPSPRLTPQNTACGRKSSFL
jgi:hypothetical protein